MAKSSLLSAILSFLALSFVCLQIYQGLYQGGASAILWGGLWAFFAVVATILAIVALRKTPQNKLSALSALALSWIPMALLALGAIVFG